jgi:hypothetical protein
MRLTAAVICCSAALAACESAPPPTTVVVPPQPAAVVVPPPAMQASNVNVSRSPEPQRLSMTETRTLVSGNTAVGVSANGSPYRAYFAPDGTVRFNNAVTSDQGTWEVQQDGSLCTTLPHVAQGAEHCYAIVREGRVILYERDNMPEGSFRVVLGNPMTL